MVGDDPVADGQPEPGSLFLGLGGEERIEYPRHDGLGDAGPGILYGDLYMVVLLERPHPYGPLLLVDGIDGIVDEVHEHLFHAVHVGPDVQRFQGVFVHDRDAALLDDGGVEIDRPADDLPQVEDILFGGLVP